MRPSQSILHCVQVKLQTFLIAEEIPMDYNSIGISQAAPFNQAAVQVPTRLSGITQEPIPFHSQLPTQTDAKILFQNLLLFILPLLLISQRILKDVNH